MTRHQNRMTVRGLLTGGALGKRRFAAQVSMRKNEVAAKVEIFLPYGFSANPVAAPSADVVVLEIGGVRDHLVGFLDDSALRIADLQPGEFGLRDGRGQQIVFRTNKIEIATTHPIIVNGQNATITTTGDCILAAGGTVQLGAAGGKKVVLDGDPVVAGAVVASSTKVKGT